MVIQPQMSDLVPSLAGVRISSKGPRGSSMVAHRGWPVVANSLVVAHCQRYQDEIHCSPR
jgi:hypothetical protein